jgi:hypothetical protein
MVSKALVRTFGFVRARATGQTDTLNSYGGGVGVGVGVGVSEREISSVCCITEIKS